MQLESRRQLVNIVDYDNVLKNFYNNREIGSHDNCLIQIVRMGANSSDIIIKYTAGRNSSVNYNSNVVSGGNMLALAEMRHHDLPPAPVLDADAVENDEIEKGMKERKEKRVDGFANKTMSERLLGKVRDSEEKLGLGNAKQGNLKISLESQKLISDFANATMQQRLLRKAIM